MLVRALQFLAVAAVVVTAACTDNSEPVAPKQAAAALTPALPAEVSIPSGASSICAASKWAMVELNRALSRTPNASELVAAIEEQDAIVDDVCN